jgi:hypothetical protein
MGAAWADLMKVLVQPAVSHSGLLMMLQTEAAIVSDNSIFSTMNTFRLK